MPVNPTLMLYSKGLWSQAAFGQPAALAAIGPDIEAHLDLWCHVTLPFKRGLRPTALGGRIMQGRLSVSLATLLGWARKPDSMANGEQTSFFLSMVVAYSDSHPTLYVVSP